MSCTRFIGGWHKNVDGMWIFQHFSPIAVKTIPRIAALTWKKNILDLEGGYIEEGEGDEFDLPPSYASTAPLMKD